MGVKDGISKVVRRKKGYRKKKKKKKDNPGKQFRVELDFVLYCALLHSPFDEFPLLFIKGKTMIQADALTYGEGRCNGKPVFISVHYAVYTEPNIV